MKKPKVSLNGAAIKTFFINNGEKLVLGLVVLLLINFAYSAITAKQIEPGMAKKIQDESRQAEVRIQETPWNIVLRDHPEWIPRNYPDDSKVNNGPLVNTVALVTDTPLQPKIFPELVKREDPKILPPIELTGTAQVVLVPYSREIAQVVNPANPNALPPRVARNKEEKDAKKGSKKGTGKTGPEGEMMGPGGPGGPGAAYPGPGRRPRGGDEENPTAGAPATDRQIGSAQLPGARATNADLKPKAMAIVTGLVPFEEQYKEYKKRFEEALGKGSTPASGPGGDQYTPIYVYFSVERAEVKDHRDQNLVWKPIDILTARAEQQLKMLPTTQQNEPPIDPLYSFLGGSAASAAAGSMNEWTGFLEWPLPPVMLRNWGFEVTHPKVPFVKPVVMDNTQEQKFYAPGEEPTGPDGRPLQNPGVGPGVGPRGPQGGGYGGHRGMGGEEFSGRGPRMMGPNRSYGGENMPGMSAAPQVPYKLYRYVDLTCAPGKRYRYRVKLKLANPNYQLPAAYLKNPESAKQPYVSSDWSAPSSVIEIPMNGQALAVAATTGTQATAFEPEGQISIQQIVKWEKAEERGKKAPPAATDPLAGAAFQNMEPTEGWIEVLQEKLKVPLGGLVYFPKQTVEKVLDMAVEIEKKKVEGLTLSCQQRGEAMLLDLRSEDPLGLGKSKGITEILYFAPDGRLFSTHSGVDKLISDDYKDRTYVPANITGGGFGPGSEFGPRGGGRFGPGMRE